LRFIVASNAESLAAAHQLPPIRRFLVLELNRGKAPAQMKLIARGDGYQIFLLAAAHNPDHPNLNMPFE